MIQNSMKIKSNELRIYSTKVLIRKFVFACLGVILINFFPLYSAHAERSSDRHDEMVFDYGCEGNAVESCWITASGIITQGTAERFRNFLESGVEGMYITLASPGGNLVEGVRMGRLIREYGFFTNIMEECLSACAYAFLGGKNRKIDENSVLGFHQFSSNLELPELVSQQLSAELLKYVIEMGVDARVFVSASMTSPDEFFYVDEALGSEFGILSPNLFSEINVDIRSGVIFAFSDRQIPLEPYDRSKRVEFYCTDEIYYISLFADRIEGSRDAPMPHSSHFPAWVTPASIVVDDKSHEISLENIDLFNRRDEYEYRFMIDSGLAKEIYSGSTIYIGFWRPRAASSDIRFNLILNDIERDRIEGAYTHCASGSANILDVVNSMPSFSCWLTSPTARVTNVNEYVNLRRQPDFSARVIRRVPLGEQVRPVRFDNLSVIGQERARHSCINACQAFGANPDDRSARDRVQKCIDDNMLWYEITDARGNRGWVSRKFLKEAE